MTINRAFTRIEEGEIHYRYAGLIQMKFFI